MIPDLSQDATADALLVELEKLSHADRVRRMVELGHRASTGDSMATATLQALSIRTGFYERFLVVESCYGSRNGAQVLQALSDPSRILRRLALRLVPIVCTDEQVLAALEGASRKIQAVLLLGISRRRRSSVTDAFLERLAASVDDRISQLLPFGSTEAVARLLPAASPLFGIHDWTRLARRHPSIAFEALHQRSQAQTEPDPRLLLHVNAVLAELAQSRPDDALTLVRSLLRHEPPRRLDLQRLAARRPDEMADLLLAHEDGGAARVSLSKCAYRLSPERLMSLLRHRVTLLPQKTVWLRRLSPDLRRASYEQAGLGWRDAEGIIDAAIITLLPGDIREKEARRHLALPALVTRPVVRLPYAAFLPWDEARAVLETSIRNPDADVRTVALSTLINIARFQRERLSDVLAVIRARANEQDPVRRAMLSTLAALPPSRWRIEHLEEIGQIVQAALDAADLSFFTQREAERLIVALVPFHPEWAAPWLGTLVKSRGQLSFQGLGDRLTDADVLRIAPALLPVLEAWETRERDRFVVQVAYSLGRRLRIFDKLIDILERLVITSRQGYTISQILGLLAWYRPDRLAVIVPTLLESDPSAITLSPVHHYLHRQRQDLLNRFLGQHAYTGRFGTGKTRFVLPFTTGFHRWTHSQQTTFADTLNQITEDTSRDAPSIARAISQLAALPAVTPTRLIELADHRTGDQAVREATLRALGRLDSGEGIALLVEALGDSRARVAIYALRSAILEMPPERALTLLQNAPTEKITVAKEVVRLLGELDTPDVYRLLLEMDSRPLHRDVRVALLRALWDHIERDETWLVLNRAAADPDPAVAAGVVRIPTDHLSSLAQQRLLNLMTVLLDHADPRVRLDTLERCVTLPVSDPHRVLLPRLLTSLSSPLPDESAVAARAVFATYAGSTQQDATTIAEAIGNIKRDRRVLVTALGALHVALTENRTRLRPTTRAVIEALADDPLAARHRVELAVAGLPWEEVAGYLTHLAAVNELHAEALMAAVSAIQGSVSRHSDEAGLSILEAALAESPDERLRRLALAAVVARAVTTVGWTTELRTRLDKFRRDPAPLVAAAAQFTFPPPEETADQITAESGQRLT